MTANARTPGQKRRRAAGITATALIACMLIAGIVTAITSTAHSRPTRQEKVVGHLTENPRPAAAGHGNYLENVASAEFPTLPGRPHRVLTVDEHAKRGDPITAYWDLEDPSFISADPIPHQGAPNKLVWAPLWITIGLAILAAIALVVYVRLRKRHPTPQLVSWEPTD